MKLVFFCNWGSHNRTAQHCLPSAPRLRLNEARLSGPLVGIQGKTGFGGCVSGMGKAAVQTALGPPF